MALPRRSTTLGLWSTLVTLVAANEPGTPRAPLSLWDSPSSFSFSSSSSKHPKRDITCEDVHIFLGRGWKEDYPGRQGVLVDAICAGQTSATACGYEDIIFDDSASSTYGPAVYQGAVAGLAQVGNYVAACPDAKIVLSGYSEGAHVVGDVLAGGGGDFFGSTEEDVTGLDSSSSSPGSKIAAALLWGDPRHTASQSYNVQSGADDTGVYPRSGDNLASLNDFGSVLRSYCLSGDEVCASGDDEDAHTSYFEDSVGLVDDAASWVRSMVGITATATVTATLSADLPATDGASLASTASASSTLASSSSSSSSGSSAGSSAGSSFTVTGTAALATATGSSDQATSSAASVSATAGSASAPTSTTSSAGSGVPRGWSQSVGLVVGLGSAWRLLLLLLLF